MSAVWFWFLVVAVGLLIPTAYAGKIGAPWAPTRKRAIERAFDELGIAEEDVVVDLGAGDGKVLLAATSRGARAIGYELSPIMWAVAWLRTVGSKRASVQLHNFFRQKLPEETTMLFTFLMPDTMPRLRRYLRDQNLPNLQFLLSYAFQFKDISPIRVVREHNCAPIYIYNAHAVLDVQ